MALQGITLNKRRALRFLITTREEMYSEGAHAATHPSNNLADGASIIITTDTSSGTNITDTPKLYIGGRGRVAGTLQASAAEVHPGAPGELSQLLSSRMAQFLNAIPKSTFPPHPRDTLSLLPPSLALPKSWTSNEGSSGSLPTAAEIYIEIHDSNPDLSAAQILEQMRDQLMKLTGETDFTIVPEERNGIPFARPWLTPENHPAVAHVRNAAENAAGTTVPLGVYKGSADLQFILDGAGKNIPAFGFHAPGQGLHGPKEQVSISGVTILTKFIRNLAAHEGLLTKD